MSKRGRNSVRAPPAAPAGNPGSTPQSSSLVAVETTNEDVSSPANVDQSGQTDFMFHPPHERNAWNLLAKSPATHRHRIKELDYMTSHYNTVGQGENIEAAKQWHASLPLDELMGYETAYFYKGKKVTRTELGSEAPIWVEQPPHVMLMAGQGPPSSCLNNPPGLVYEGILDANIRFEAPSSRKPSDLVPRWPVTHGQRIAELKFLATFYNKTGQAQNLQAAIDWHSKFPPDTWAGNESLYFQRGVVVDEFERRLQDGPCWYEGPPPDDVMAGHGRRSAPALPVAATTTGSTPQSSTLVTRAVETTNEDVSYPANVDQFEHVDLCFHPPDSRNPPDLVPRWPVTHRQRIAELKFLATFYNRKGQEANLAAAIEWHSGFPPEDFAGYESAHFQGGVVKDATELRTGGGPIWYEGPPDDDMMA